MKLNSLTLVSGNKNKAREIERILNIPLKVVDKELEEIQELDVEKVALHKVNQAYEIVKSPVIVDDVSFEIAAWSGFPGPLIKWLLHASGGDNASVMLRMLEGVVDRRVIAKLAIGFHDGESAKVFIGECPGTVARQIRGENGFGWDPVFIPDGYEDTFAEMDPKIKDSISHRGKALSQFSDFLKANYAV
jgi:non-canonical purine NTP pyrophosphatase (RdgB/HAM1 family)